MTTRVLFVRHTDVQNPDNVFYGRLPRFGLSQLGREQAERTAAYLRDESIAAIYTSPQLRARQTSRVLGQYHPAAPIVVTRLIAEVRSSVQGMRFGQIGASVNLYEPPRAAGDETIPGIYARMRRCLLQVASRHADETTICVSHADPIMFLRAGIQGKALVLANMRGPDYPEKGSITEFRFDTLGDAPAVSYLDPRQFPAAVAVPV